MKTYYVVHKGKVPGIYSTWDICKKHVTNFDGAIFKKFTNETDAKTFLINGFGDKKPKPARLQTSAMAARRRPVWRSSFR